MEFHRAMTGARAFVSGALARDRSRDVWKPRWLQGLGQNVRLMFRALAAAPIRDAHEVNEGLEA